MLLQGHGYHVGMPEYIDVKHFHKQNLHIYSTSHACLCTMMVRYKKELPQPSKFNFQRTLVYCLYTGHDKRL